MKTFRPSAAIVPGARFCFVEGIPQKNEAPNPLVLQDSLAAIRSFRFQRTAHNRCPLPLWSGLIGSVQTDHACDDMVGDPEIAGVSGAANMPWVPRDWSLAMEA